ncbi:MAG TPA: hypothetical protein VMR99_01340 [Candidatus Paceibacterota bacterium]|nr:hypothetical protein [Candidatus Paceibacterota bacterium]
MLTELFPSKLEFRGLSDEDEDDPTVIGSPDLDDEDEDDDDPADNGDADTPDEIVDPVE